MVSLRLLSACIGLLLAALALPGTVAADDHGVHYVLRPGMGATSYSATITTSARGVSIDVRGQASYSGQYTVPGSTSGSSLAYASNPAPGAGASSSSTAHITRTWYNPQGEPYYQTSNGTVYHLEGVNISYAGSGKEGWFTVGSRQHPGSVPEALYVGGHFQGIVWVPLNGKGNVQPAGAPAGSGAGEASAAIVVDPRAVAQDVLQHIPLPNAQIRMNPSLGLVGMPGWFWVEGYNGQPFGGAATVGALTVSVQVQPTSYTWDFGDGSTLVSHDLGQPYPAESDIQHTYQYSSLHHPDGFPIQLTIQFSASYSVNGGPAEPLSAMARTYSAGYRVQELQSLLTNR